jgi:hypothetical protein
LPSKPAIFQGRVQQITIYGHIWSLLQLRFWFDFCGKVCDTLRSNAVKEKYRE